MLIFCLFTPDRLSEPALEALGDAENGAGIVVSVATLGDLWYASHKSGPNSPALGAYESLRRTVLDSTTNFDVVSISADTMEYFDRVPLVEVSDRTRAHPQPWRGTPHARWSGKGLDATRFRGNAQAVRALLSACRAILADMAYDDELANRIRQIAQSEPGLSEKRMFGGLAFLVHGNMAVSASSQGGLLLRIDPAQAESLVIEAHVRRFEMRDREMDGWLRVDAQALESDDELRRWVNHGVTYARSLAPK
jgi:TfoX/Sxy family transcriptional regulator of competence genes